MIVTMRTNSNSEKYHSLCWIVVADACQFNYSGDKHWQDHGLRPTWAKSSCNIISDNNSAWWYLQIIPGTWEVSMVRIIVMRQP
jgi:hypothetical protein